jgi:hypothetical protein
MFALTKRILDVLCPTGKDNCIGVTTDGAKHDMLVWLHRFSKCRNVAFLRGLVCIASSRLKSMVNEEFAHVIQATKAQVS